MRLTLEFPTDMRERFGRRSARIGPGTFVPVAYTAVIEFEDEDVVRLDIEVRDGRPECCAVHVERGEKSPPLSGDELRRLPVTSWVEAATVEAAAVATLRWSEPAPREGGGTVRKLRQSTPDEVRGEAARSVRRQVALTPDRLREVAYAYRQADGVATEVAAVLNVSRAQVYRLIRAAREGGYLDEGSDDDVD